MELKNLLTISVLIVVTIIGVSLGSQILGQMASSTASYYVYSEDFIVDYDSPVSITNSGTIKADSDTVTCSSTALTRTTDYTFDIAVPTFTVITYPRTSTNETFVSNLDKNITLTGLVPYRNTAKVFYCNENATTFSNATDYTLYPNGKLTVLSGGDMINNTHFCINYTYALTSDGATCSGAYQYGTESNNLFAQGQSALGQWGNWWTILIVVAIAVIVIGLLMRLGQTHRGE
jgi:hypothetical protein